MTTAPPKRTRTRTADGARSSAAMVKLWADPAFREMMLERRKASFTPERAAKISAKAKERWADPVYKARVIESLRGTATGKVFRGVQCTVLGVQYPSINEAARKTGISRSGIDRFLKGKIKTLPPARKAKQ